MDCILTATSYLLLDDWSIFCTFLVHQSSSETSFSYFLTVAYLLQQNLLSFMVILVFRSKEICNISLLMSVFNSATNVKILIIFPPHISVDFENCNVHKLLVLQMVTQLFSGFYFILNIFTLYAHICLAKHHKDSHCTLPVYCIQGH